MDGRLNRRMVGVLGTRLPEVALSRVHDPRRVNSTKWNLGKILNSVVIGLLTGCKSLAQLEALTSEMSPASRRRLGINRRMPDTTARDTLVRLNPEEIRQAIYRQVKIAHRRKALAPVDLPFGVVAMDGKSTMVKDLGWEHSQARTAKDGSRYGLVRTVTATLISSSSKICIDAAPIPSMENEQSYYEYALGSLIDNYGSLNMFKLLTYDAGGCSRFNARATVSDGLHYLMRVKPKSQPKLSKHMMETLTGKPAFVDEEKIDSNTFRRRSLFISEDVAVWEKWTKLKTIVRVLFEVIDADGQIEETQERLYVSSLAENALTKNQWIQVTRNHWNVENNCHHTFDAVFREDEKPWIRNSAKGMTVVLLLRRIAYNILTLFRSVTQRTKANRLTPWRDICRYFYNALIASKSKQLEGMRIRKPPDELLE